MSSDEEEKSEDENLWKDLSEYLPRPLEDPNDPNSEKLDIVNPQLFTIENHILILGGYGFDECYLGKMNEKKEENTVSWKQFGQLPFAIDYSSQPITHVKLENTHVFYAFWRGKIYSLTVDKIENIESSKWEEVTLEKGGKRVDYGGGIRTCVHEHFIFITCGRCFDVFNSQTNAYYSKMGDVAIVPYGDFFKNIKYP